MENAGTESAAPRTGLAKPADVAEYTGQTLSTLANWRYLKQGPPFIKLGGSVRYRWSDVESWLDSQTVTGR